MTERKCPDCDTPLGPDPRQVRCKPCKKRKANTKYRLGGDPEKYREYQRKYRLANPEKYRGYHRKYRLANLEKYREWQRKHWLADPEKYREKSRKYRLANPEKCRERTRKRHADQKAARKQIEWLKTLTYLESKADG